MFLSEAGLNSGFCPGLDQRAALWDGRGQGPLSLQTVSTRPFASVMKGE